MIWKRFGCCLSALALVILIPAAASAVQVEVFVPREGSATSMTLRRQAMTKGFAQAVALQAQAMLPGHLSEERFEALRERLAPNAGKYVQGYKELGVSQSPDGLAMGLDVAVNQAALKKELMRLGVYYTSKESLPFTLNVSGGGPEDFSNLVGLQELTGVTARAGAVPVLSLVQDADGSWRGELVTAQGERQTAVNRDLTSLWTGLWERYFSAGSTSERFMPTQTLVVQGWYVSEGVRGFDMMLAEQGELIESAELVGMTMRPLGIEAVWRLRVGDPQALRALLEEYVASRSLTYRFEETGSNNPATDNGGG